MTPHDCAQAPAAGPEISVLVGASGTLGTVVAQALADAGQQVLAVARSADALRALAQTRPPAAAADPAPRRGSITACVADIADDAAIAAIAEGVLHLGGPQACVRLVAHAAGVATAGGVLQAPTAALVDAVNIKVAGLLRLVRAVEAQLRPGSRIVAVGGHYGFEPSAYAATAGVANAALANLVRQLSWACGARGVTAHLLAPGPVESERLQRVASARAERDGLTAQQVLTQMRSESALGAFTTPAQIAWAITLLLAPEADALAGSTLFLDAGRRKGLP